MHLKYQLHGSALDHELRHPQNHLRDLGITYQHATPQSMGDCWWFWNCENIPEVIPDYIVELKVNPMECIGYGLSPEMAEKIRDYKGV